MDSLLELTKEHRLTADILGVAIKLLEEQLLYTHENAAKELVEIVRYYDLGNLCIDKIIEDVFSDERKGDR